MAQIYQVAEIVAEGKGFTFMYKMVSDLGFSVAVRVAVKKTNGVLFLDDR